MYMIKKSPQLKDFLRALVAECSLAIAHLLRYPCFPHQAAFHWCYLSRDIEVLA